MIDLNIRSGQEELMDNFSGSIAELEVVLDDITRVNKVLGGNDITVNAVFRLFQENPKKSYTIMDMGCADGNMLRELAKQGRKLGIELKLFGFDLNTDALTIAKEKSKDLPEITYDEKDVLHDDFSKYAPDVVITTLMMHHFTDPDVLQFSNRFVDLASLGVVVNDLHRSALAYYLYMAFSLIFIKTKVAKIDGLISISKGFVKSDLKGFANSIANADHEIRWKWAFRYLWIMRKKSDTE